MRRTFYDFPHLDRTAIVRRQGFCFLVWFLFSPPSLVLAANHQSDAIIYGGTSAAIIAAVRTKSMGKSVVVVSRDRHLGGLTSGGLGGTDSGKKDAVGGLSRDFYHLVWKHHEANDAGRWQDKSTLAGKEQSVS